MVVGKVHAAIYMPVVFHLGSVGQGEAHTAEDIDDFVLDNRERMARTESNGVGSTCEVDGCRTCSSSFACIVFQGSYLLLSQGLEFVDFHANLFLLFGRHVAEIIHQL